MVTPKKVVDIGVYDAEIFRMVRQEDFDRLEGMGTGAHMSEIMTFTYVEGDQSIDR